MKGFLKAACAVALLTMCVVLFPAAPATACGTTAAVSPTFNVVAPPAYSQAIVQPQAFAQHFVQPSYAAPLVSAVAYPQQSLVQSVVVPQALFRRELVVRR